MAAWRCVIFLVVAFIIISKVIGVIENSTRVFAVSKESMQIMQDHAMDDLVKEKAVQGYAIELFKLFFLITLGSAVALAVPFAVVYGLSVLDIVSLQQVLELSLSWKFLGLILAASVVYFVWKSRKLKSHS